MSDLPACPECGNPPEIFIRSRGEFNFGSAQIRCPYNHYRHGFPFAPGSQKKAREELRRKWLEIISKGGAA